MSEQDKPDQSHTPDVPVLGHAYDGIQEYDNPLPSWWLFLFIATVIFAFHYFVHYEIGGGPTMQDELKVSMDELKETSLHNHSHQVAESEDDLMEKMKSPEIIAAGKIAFIGKCAACHGDNGQGIIGPNLTDHFWIHGKGKRADIVAVIRRGATDKGMPAWESILKPDELITVAAYVYSLRDTHPAQGKAPQGEEVK